MKGATHQEGSVSAARYQYRVCLTGLWHEITLLQSCVFSRASSAVLLVWTDFVKNWWLHSRSSWMSPLM